MNGYIQQRVRKVIAWRDLTVDAAIDFLKNNKYAIVEDDDGNTLTLEDLEYAKNIESRPGTESDNTASSGGQVSEDSYRELFGIIADNPESSSDSDN